jgi:hypothetical protein
MIARDRIQQAKSEKQTNANANSVEPAVAKEAQ